MATKQKDGYVPNTPKSAEQNSACASPYIDVPHIQTNIVKLKSYRIPINGHKFKSLTLNFSVKSHLDKLKLSVFGYEAVTVFNSLLSALKQAPWIRFTGQKFVKRGPDIYSFSCKQLHAIDLLLFRDSFFAIRLLDPSIRFQTDILSALHSASTGFKMTTILSEAEFALNFYPVRHSSLNTLADFLFRSVVLKHSRSGSYSLFRNKEDGSVTHYHGHGGNVRSSKHTLRGQSTVTISENGSIAAEKKQGKSSKGLRCYLKDGYARIELNANSRFLKRLRLNVSSLPLSPDAADVLAHIEFRKGLDPQSLKNLCAVINRKQSLTGKKLPYPPLDTRYLQNWFVVEAFRVTGIKMPLDKISVSLQMSIFKGLKQTYGFTNQVDQFFPIDAALMSAIKNKGGLT